MNPQPPDGAPSDAYRLSGIVLTGTRKAAFFTQLEWVRAQCAEKLGFEPYPGTLNLKLKPSDRGLMEEIRDVQGVALVPPDDQFCSSRAVPVRIGKIPGALILPEENVNVHGADVVEVLAPVHLRGALNLKDGSLVSIEVLEKFKSKKD